MSQQIWWAAVNTRNCHRGLIFGVARGEKPLRRKNGLRATIHYSAWRWANYLKDSSNGKWTRDVDFGVSEIAVRSMDEPQRNTWDFVGTEGRRNTDNIHLILVF
jgi:hypothetical protein